MAKLVVEHSLTGHRCKLFTTIYSNGEIGSTMYIEPERVEEAIEEWKICLASSDVERRDVQ